MQLYRERDFGELLSDTFDFVKAYGKNYFKNYILINGLIIILLLIVFYFGFGDLLQQFFGSNVEGQQFYMEDYFQENQGTLIASFLLLFFIYLLLSLVSYSYPILYMKRIAETHTTEITANDMVNDIKGNLGKFIIFFLGIMFIILPILFIVFLISGLLMFIIIGFFLLLIAMPAALNIINFAFYHYLHTNSGFFQSLGYGFNAQFSKKFWKYWGSVTIMYLLLQIVTSIFTTVPMLLDSSSDLIITPDAVPTESSGSMLLIMVVYGISFVISFILSNLIYINCGLMYYDSREDLHRNRQFSEIENIGIGEG